MAIQPSAVTAEQQKAPLKPSKEEVTRQAQETKAALEAERVYRKGIVTMRDIIAPAAFKVEPDHLRLGTKFLRTLFVTAYPRYIEVGWFAPIINFPATIDISMFFYPLPADIVLKQLKKKVGTLEAQVRGDQEAGKPRDPAAEAALRDVEKLRDDLTQGIEKFFQFALYATIYANSKEELNKLTDQIDLIFGARLVMARKVLYQSEQGFNSTIPLGNDELMVAFNMNSSPCASSFPFISSDLTSDNGILYGINRHNNSLILFDRFSVQNAKMVVFATSGAGKSYAMKLE
ncbi:conjugal transfer protein TraC, partial [Candidatus Uhrbacteria bacterium]|nr:conjugal transfer protein TraC [Candidatus Uhrbacteria bacterium]